jgi:1-acyl-sn-glycerol-3-phosphate acyltransferase
VRSSPGRPTPLAVRALGGFIYRVLRVVHRASLEGIEHLPDGAYLLVGNHPPCLGQSEFFSLAALWIHHFGATRPLAGYTHVMAHRIWPLPWFFAQVGAIPSTYEAAYETLERGVPIVLFPGGDHEAFRPFWKRGVDFHGREGFLRIARRAGVPIVPIAITGESAPVLLRGRVLAWLAIWPRLLGLKRWGITVLGVLGAVALALTPWAWPWRALAIWAWLVSPASLLSWLPTRTRIRIGGPMPVSSTRREVEQAIEALL